MKQIAILFSILITINSCAKSAVVTEEYKLIETLFDPGDGSGVFNPTNSGMTLILYDNDSFETKKGALCSTFDSSTSDNGNINFLTNTLTSKSCSNAEFKMNFEIEGDLLKIYLPCIEPCILKFRKT